nr:hypothetical protein Iba_chr12bCG11580 [Ipomoea batatas]
MPLLREHIWHKHPKGPVPLLLLTNLDTIHLVMVQWMLDKQERHQVHDIEPGFHWPPHWLTEIVPIGHWHPLS